MRQYHWHVLFLFFLMIPFSSFARLEPDMKLVEDLCWCGIEFNICDDWEDAKCNVSAQEVCSLLCPS